MNMERSRFRCRNGNIAVNIRMARRIAVPRHKSIGEKKPLILKSDGIIVVVDDDFQFAVSTADFSYGEAFSGEIIIFRFLVFGRPHPLPARYDKVIFTRNCRTRNRFVLAGPIYGIRNRIILVPGPGIVPRIGRCRIAKRDQRKRCCQYSHFSTPSFLSL